MRKKVRSGERLLAKGRATRVVHQCAVQKASIFFGRQREAKKSACVVKLGLTLIAEKGKRTTIERHYGSELYITFKYKKLRQKEAIVETSHRNNKNSYGF